MKRQLGFTLIEVIIFIIVLSIVATGLFVSFNTVLALSANPGKNLAASQLAKARMSIILQNRLVNGFSSITDPCSSGSPPAPCSILATFATNNNLFVSSSIGAVSGGIQTVQVSVTGSGTATLTMRFVE